MAVHQPSASPARRKRHPFGVTGRAVDPDDCALVLFGQLLEQLARQGRRLGPDDSMLVNAEPVRGIPVSAPLPAVTSGDAKPDTLAGLGSSAG
jgi:hypothetical protein